MRLLRPGAFKIFFRRRPKNLLSGRQSKREIVRVKSEENGAREERCTGDYIFENECQSFHTQKDRPLKLKSIFHERASGRPSLYLAMPPVQKGTVNEQQSKIYSRVFAFIRG